MIHNKPLYVIILAAGKGTRMKSDRAKVLHEVYFSPMIHHVVDTVVPLQPTKITVVVGHQREAVIAVLADYDVDFAVQEEQCGTGHAVLIAESLIPEGPGTVLILCGDTPLIQSETLQNMVAQHQQDGPAITLMTTELDDPTNYGRVKSDANGDIEAIVEEKDANVREKKITEINTGIYCVERDLLFATLKGVGSNNQQNEVYLTDIINKNYKKGRKIARYKNNNAQDVLGVNSRYELSQANEVLQMCRNIQLMYEGVTMENPASISVAPQVTIGRDSTLAPGCRLSGTTTVGRHCVLEQGVILENCDVGDNVHIGAYSVLCDEKIASNTRIAPHRTSPLG